VLRPADANFARRDVLRPQVFAATTGCLPVEAGRLQSWLCNESKREKLPADWLEVA
jgi:hypothetical protein